MDFLRYLEGIRTDTLTNIFKSFTIFGEELIVLAIICSMYWCYNKQLAYKICFSYFISGLLVQALKITFRIPRPWVLDEKFSPVHSAIDTATGYSFPSGHTQSAVALYGTLAIGIKKRWRQLLFLIIAVSIAFSRMYLGVHTPKDVVVSFFLSGIIVICINVLMTEQFLIKYRGMICAVMVLFSLIALIYANSLLKQESITFEYAADCCKAAGAGIGFSIGWYLETEYIQFTEKGCNKGLQVLKFALGVLGAFAIKSGLKFIIGDSLIADIFRYALMVLWVTTLYPIIIKKYFTRYKN